MLATICLNTLNAHAETQTGGDNSGGTNIVEEGELVDFAKFRREFGGRVENMNVRKFCDYDVLSTK